MPKKVSERIVAALLTMLIGSAFLEEIRLKICSCRIVKCLESKELIEFQSALWYSLTLMEGSIDLLRLVEKDTSSQDTLLHEYISTHGMLTRETPKNSRHVGT